MKKVIGLNERVYSWNLSKYAVLNDSTRPRSKYHKLARSLIKEIFGSYIILEEPPMPGSGTKMLYLDFFVPSLDLAVEVHGEQHYNFIPFFHENRKSFLKAQYRDNNKILWCEKNNIDLVILKYSDDEQIWRDQLVKRGS